MANGDTGYKVDQLFTLQEKTACVTGGSGGLGYVMTQALLQNGCKVLIASRKENKCEEARLALSKFGDVQAVAADVGTAEGRESIRQRLEQNYGKLDILVNNAGTNWAAPIEDYPDEGFAKVMQTNVNAVFSLSRDLLPLLKAAARQEDPARIVNIGSMDGLHVPIVQRVPTFAYSASKAALHHLTRVLAVDLGPSHITVNAVAPGFFESKMTDFVFEHYLQDIEADCPLGRIGHPAEVAGVLLYLASRAGAYTNGAVIPVDGGTHISKGRRDWMQEGN